MSGLEYLRLDLLERIADFEAESGERIDKITFERNAEGDIEKVVVFL